MKIWALVTLVLNASWGLNPPNKKPKSQKCSKMRFLTILKFLKIHQKINFCSVRGVTGKSRGQEISIFEVFENYKIFENFGKLASVKKKKTNAQKLQKLTFPDS